MNPLVLIGLIGGALFLAKGAKKKKVLDPLLEPLPDVDMVKFDMYPASLPMTAAEWIPSTDTSITYSPDCTVIAVAEGWWEGVAKPFVETHEGTSVDVAMELVTTVIPCNEKNTAAVDEFLADVDAATKAWRQTGFDPVPEAPLPHPEVPEVPGMDIGFDPTATPEAPDGPPKATIGN